MSNKLEDYSDKEGPTNSNKDTRTVCYGLRWLHEQCTCINCYIWFEMS